jgi:hypothetical protein
LVHSKRIRQRESYSLAAVSARGVASYHGSACPASCTASKWTGTHSVAW